MNDTNGWWFTDLALVVGLAGIAIGGVQLGIGGAARIGLAMPLLVLLPGYAIVSMLFPENAGETEKGSFDDDRTGLWNPQDEGVGIDRTARFVLSVVMSVAVVPVVALIASFTPQGIVLRSLLVGLGIVTGVFSLLAFVRRLGRSADRRYAPSFGAFWSGLFYTASAGRFEGSGTGTTVYNVAIVVSLLLLVSSVGYAVVNPQQHEGFTELYVDSGSIDGDDQSMYQTTYPQGESQTFAVNVTNREHHEVRYTTVVLLQRVSDEDGGATVTEEAELAKGSITVSDGSTERQAFQITPGMTGEDLRIAVLLYEGDPPADPSAENAYRVLQLPITVGEGGNSQSSTEANASMSVLTLPSGGR